jgi:hypothetical protein
MKKLFVLITVLAIALVMCACNKPAQEVSAPTAEPTGAPTEEPTPVPTEAPTPAPADVPTPEPTEVPAPTAMPTEVPVELKPIEGGDYFAYVRQEQPYIVDMDGDGLDDIVFIRAIDNSTEDNYDVYTLVTIERGCDPDSPFELVIPNLFDDFVYAVVADCEPETPAKELIISVDENDWDYETYLVRLKDDGSEFEHYSIDTNFNVGSARYWGHDDEWTFDSSIPFEFMIGTSIMGSNYLTNQWKVTSEGITVLNEEYAYDEPGTAVVKQDFEMTADDGSVVTVKKGTKLNPIGTDRETFVRLRLEDGTTGIVELTVEENDYSFYYFINGEDQNDLFELEYFG